MDRRGQPRCSQCPDRDDRDPLAVLAETIGQVDPSLPAQTITAAARRVFSRPAKLRQLAWAIEDQPELLAGDGARAPIPGVLRLIGELCDAGAQVITRPAARAASASSSFTAGSTGCGAVAPALPGPGRSPAPGAEQCARQPSATSTAGRRARTA